METAGNHVVKTTPLELEFDVNISDHRYQHLDSEYESHKCEPLIELPASPSRELEDIEDLLKDSDHCSNSGETDDDILTIRLESKVLRESKPESANKKIISTKGDTTETWDILNFPVPSPKPILKLAGRLLTVHKV